jgi:hypothetical protein
MAILKNTSFDGAQYLQLPVGTTGQRPSSPINGDIRFNSTFKIVETYINNSWKYVPPISETGLVLRLDAAEPISYPGSGTTWSDLSGNGNVGTLINGVGYNSINGGSFAFDGVDDLVIIPENNLLNTQRVSVEVWAKTNAISQNGFWFEKGNINTQYSLFQQGTTIIWRGNFGAGFVDFITLTTASFINTSNWFHIVATFISGQQFVYINGVLVGSNTLAGTLATNTNGCSIGAYGGFNGARAYYYNGSIASVSVYNRALTPLEISQNFNAIRGRYGI